MVSTVEKALTEDTAQTNNDAFPHYPASQWPDFLKELGDED